MKHLPMILTIAIMVCTFFATLMAITFCMGMGANSTPGQIRMLKFWMAGLSLIGVGGIVAGIFLLRAGLVGWAMGISALPIAIFIVIFIIALLVSG